MSVPAYPYNRHEQYLNRIATGEGDIPPYPQNREEQYLAAIVENGGGGGGGSGGGVLVVTAAENEQGTKLVCDKTAAEMYAAFPAIILYEVNNNAAYLINNAYKSGDDYEFAYYDPAGGGAPVVYEASSGDAYPELTLE